MDKTSLNEEKDINIIYEEKNLILKGNSSNCIQLYVKGNKSGIIIIKGVEIILENCINVKHYFNKKNKLNLYPYIKKRKKSILSELDDKGSPHKEGNKRQRKISTSSQNSSKSSGSNISYKFHYKYKEAITCEIKDNNNDINVSFPYGMELKLYKNELFFMPIKICNNSNIIIKQFCFYFSDDENDIEKSCILNEIIFKELEISNNKENKNNEKILYVPLIPKKLGKILLKVLFKYEEEKTMTDYEIQRFIIILNVQDSFSFNVKEIVNKYDSNFILADIDIYSCINYYNNDYTLDNLIINPKINFGQNYEQIFFQKNQNENNDNFHIIYNKYKIKKRLNKNNSEQKSLGYVNRFKNEKRKINKNIDELFSDIKLEFLDKYDFIKYDKIQSHIKHSFYKLFIKDYLIFNWSAKEKNTNRIINGIFIYKPKLIFSIFVNFSFSNFIKNLLHMKHSKRKFDKVTICSLDISIDNAYYNQLENVKGIEIFINKEEHNSNKVNWIGLQKYKINKINDDSEKEKEIHFSCIISEKGIYDINQISLLTHFYFTRNEKKLFNKILSPIIVEIN